MGDEKAPVDKAVELFLYAPVGAACYVRDMLPSMMGIFVARGKREVQSHRTPPPPTPPIPPVPPEVKRRIDDSVGVARTVAEGGFGVARDVAGSGFGAARDVASTALAQLIARRPNGADASSDEPPSAAPHPSSSPPDSASSAPANAPVPPDAAWHTDVPLAESLPIPDYDELSASQVVERLEGLDRASLDAVRRYEAGHRGRNTILGKIAQLG